MNMDKEVSFPFFPFSGITRLPVLEGEVSHVEIPRTSPSLGITIVGGADTPLVSSALPINSYAWRVSICSTILTKTSVPVGLLDSVCKEFPFDASKELT